MDQKNTKNEPKKKNRKKVPLKISWEIVNGPKTDAVELS